MQKPLLLHHINKTAGTALIHYFEGAFPPEQAITRLGHDEEAKAQTLRVLRLTPEEKNNIRVICGHEAYKMLPYFPDVLQGAFFRHPIYRIISQYNFEHAHAESYGIDRKKRPLINDVGVKVFLQRVLDMSQENDGYNANFQAKSLGKFLGKNVDAISAEDLPKYINRLNFIGLKEYFNLSIFMMHKLYGFPLRSPHVVNVLADSRFTVLPRWMLAKSRQLLGLQSPRRGGDSLDQFKPYYLPRWFIAKCERYFHLDFLLYELASRRFDEQYERVVSSSEHSSSEWLRFRKLCPELSAP